MTFVREVAKTVLLAAIGALATKLVEQAFDPDEPEPDKKRRSRKAAR